MTMHISVVCLQEEDSEQYIAQCLEYDLNAQGDTPEEALEAFFKMIEARVAVAEELGCGAFDRVPPPPEELLKQIRDMGLDEEVEYKN